MNRVIIVGSPRAKGRSAHLAEMLFEANIDERPGDELYLVPVSEIDVSPCIACGGCRELREVVLADADGNEVSRERRHLCVIDDELQEVYPLLEAADALTIVSPVFFSGAPAPLKALLDRLQPYFWERQDARAGNGARRAKRPLELHVVGEGNDPHGYDALVSEVKSATACAGFRLERIFDWVGKIDDAGEILADAAVRELESAPASGEQGPKGRGPDGGQGQAGNRRQGSRGEKGKGKSNAGKGHEAGQKGAAQGNNRPKLKLS